MKYPVLALLIVCLVAGLAFAETTTKADYSVPSSQGFEDFLNEQTCITHTHGYSADKDGKEANLQPVVGLDIPIVEVDEVVLMSENRYNFETSVTTVGAVVVVKRSLWSIISGWLGK